MVIVYRVWAQMVDGVWCRASMAYVHAEHAREHLEWLIHTADKTSWVAHEVREEPAGHSALDELSETVPKNWRSPWVDSLKKK